MAWCCEGGRHRLRDKLKRKAATLTPTRIGHSRGDGQFSKGRHSLRQPLKWCLMQLLVAENVPRRYGLG